MLPKRRKTIIYDDVIEKIHVGSVSLTLIAREEVVSRRIDKIGYPSTMSASNRFVATLGTILAIATAVVHGFSTAPVFLPSRSSTTSLHMGIFDAFQKAFSNEEYGPPPDAVKATARHILVPTEEEAKAVMSKFSSGEIRCVDRFELRLWCFVQFVGAILSSSIRLHHHFFTVPLIGGILETMHFAMCNNQSFAALAGEYSTCPSKSRGGSLGSFSPGTMVKEFDEVIFSPQTQIGEVRIFREECDLICS